MMKHLFRYSLIAVFTAFAGFTLSSCSSDDNDSKINVETAKNKRFAKIAEQFVDHTVISTYKSLALATETLVEELQVLKTNKSQDALDKVCSTFLSTRQYWEQTEAFLFGPATIYGIDPHIDSWPLDLQGLKDELSNKAHMENMAAPDADVYVGVKLGAELLGFHGIEYILFREGHNRSISDISTDELNYATAVAGDLRNNCYRLWISWAGEENVIKAAVDKMEELELPYTVGNNGTTSYKTNMLRSGQPGSTFSSWQQAMQQIVDGMITIVDEVGTTKINMPYSGEDIDYIESPYSQKSIRDFHDNILSVQNAYMGGVSAERNELLSLHNYVKENNPKLDESMLKLIDKVLNAISSMKAPFVDNFRDPSVKVAIDACAELNDALEELKDYMGE